MTVLSYEGKPVSLTPNIGSNVVMQPILLGGALGLGTLVELRPAGKVAYFARAVVPQSGELADLSILNAAISGGTEWKAAILDTGDTNAGEYTVLAESGIVLQAEENKWQSYGALGGVVLTAGQHVLIGVMPKIEAGFISGAKITNSAAQLPSGYLAVPGGAPPTLMGKHKSSSFAFENFAFAALESLTACPIAIAHLS